MSNFTKLKLCHTFGISQSTHIWVKGALTALLLVLCGNVAKAQTDVNFNDGVRYSQWVIDSRMNEFYANTTKCGFAVYDQSGKQTADRVDGKTSLDYVVGLVAKSIIEASQYYSQFTWAQSFAKPWFLSIQNYGNKFYSGVATSGGSLDDLNAVKLYLPLRELTKPGGTFEDNTTYSNTATALNKAITGLKAHNSSYRIKDENILAKKAGHDVLGGWWHKSIYENQMWLDGAYMGSALFAELVNYSGTTTNIDSSNDWDLIVKQFTILRNMCWNENAQLPYHAFAADGGTNTTSHSNTWAGLSHSEPYVFHSASYWGRAVGWYFLALVDILEQMDKANLSSSTGYTTLKGYLAETAEGLKARQDQATGGWYQILDENGTYSASEYNNGLSHTTTYNYIESSATALFTAAYLKAIRKGYLAENVYKTVAVNGYKCLVNQFFSVDDNGNVNIFGSCRSAGLGGNEDKNAAGKEKFRDGSKPYYLLGKDVAMVKKSENITEGKVLGAFILAATEYERLYQSPMLLSKDLNKKYSLGPNESLSAEVLGEGTATYQWYDATGTTPSAIDGATNASYTPTKSGKYYCKITVNPTTAAKTRAARTEPYTITTSTAYVTVRGTSTGDTGNAGNAGKTVLFNTDFTEPEWNGVETTNSVKSTTVTIDGTKVTLQGYKDNGFSVSNGTMTFPGNNMKNNNYYIAIPVSGVNGSITIEFGGTDGYTYYYDICTKDGTPSRKETGEVTNGVVTITKSYSGTDAIIYIGRASSSKTTISSIKITTPSSSTPTTYTVTATAENGTVTITDGSGNTIASGSQVNSGTKLVFTATANSGYEFSSWTVNGTTGTESGATYTISSLTKATTVTANFTETSSGGGGTAPYYSYKVNESGLTAPGINTSKYITDSYGKKLVKMTFGGWKWNGGKYSIDRKEINEGTKDYTDSWKNSTSEQNFASIDEHRYWFEGTQDAVDESKAVSEKVIYGKRRYGWFVSPTRVDGKTTESHPFTLPVRGSFMTFEPTMNGTLSIYILQNGAWNTDKSGTYTDTDEEGTINYSKGQIAAGEFRPHAFHVVNQRGLTVQEFSPNYSVETKQKVNLDYYCMFKGDDGFDQTKYDSPYNVARWTEFKDYMSTDEQQRCHDNWNNGEGGAQTITELDNGSFLAIEKGIVKYTFHVTGNETYYFFSNFSKMGFSGARFTPDEAQPEETVTGKISTLDLSDVTAYNKITATPTGSTIEGTTLNDYTYKIGENDIAPVSGVTIPQFYSIKLTRTFKAGQWTTLTLPFNLTEEEVQSIFGDGTQIIMLDKATLSSEGGARLHFIYHEIQNVLPGYPYLIKPTLKTITNDANVSVTKADNNTALTSFTVFGKCINPFIDQFEVNTTPYTFKGTPDYCTADVTKDGSTTKYSVKYTPNDIFVSDGDGKLYVSGGSSYGKGYRAWLQHNGTTAVKSISVVMSSFSDDDDTTTSIDVAEMAPDLIEALGIQTGVYNLSGQRVANDTRNLKAGIYIVNGKKTVVR